MAARVATIRPRERRPAIWPYLVMPLIVLLVFYALFRVHQHSDALAMKHGTAVPAASDAPQQQ
jgi:hypothetical protein